MVENERGLFGGARRRSIGHRSGRRSRDSGEGQSEDPELTRPSWYSTNRFHHGVSHCSLIMEIGRVKERVKRLYDAVCTSMCVYYTDYVLEKDFKVTHFPVYPTRAHWMGMADHKSISSYPDSALTTRRIKEIQWKFSANFLKHLHSKMASASTQTEPPPASPANSRLQRAKVNATYLALGSGAAVAPSSFATRSALNTTRYVVVHFTAASRVPDPAVYLRRA